MFATARRMVKISVGMMGSSVASGSPSLATPAQLTSFLNIVKSHGVKELDTARVYNAGRSEELLGEVAAFKDFIISTKAPAFSPGSLTESNIISNCEKSLKALQMDKVDIYYLHGPDPKTPFEEQCRAIDTLYRQGSFNRFGVSNITPDQVQEVYNICKQNSYVVPSVYQGGYNPIARNCEDGLLPLLKQLNMTFYAYSPLAGGLLAKPLDKILNPEKGSRFNSMKIFGDIYLNEKNIAALKKVQSVCDGEGVALMEATMRWFMHHSPLGKEDAVILGASDDSQIEKSLSACKLGPLSQALLVAIEELKKTTEFKLPN
jgi:aflatoxin B1 aldehyde reductase